MNHQTQIRCRFPGFRAECSCGWVAEYHHATHRGAKVDAERHEHERPKIRMATYDGSCEATRSLEPPAFSDSILFGGVPFIIEHKDESCERCKGSGEGPAGMEVLPATALHSNQCIACRGTGKRISPEVAERQRLTYQQIIDREA